MTENEYRCDACGGIFEKVWTEEEAIEEHMGGPHGHVPVEQCGLVCDDCFEKMKAAGLFRAH